MDAFGEVSGMSKGAHVVALIEFMMTHTQMRHTQNLIRTRESQRDQSLL